MQCLKIVKHNNIQPPSTKCINTQETCLDLRPYGSRAKTKCSRICGGCQQAFPRHFPVGFIVKSCRAVGNTPAVPVVSDDRLTVFDQKFVDDYIALLLYYEQIFLSSRNHLCCSLSCYLCLFRRVIPTVVDMYECVRVNVFSLLYSYKHLHQLLKCNIKLNLMTTLLV